ncbi:MAG: hypothetical protein HYV95_03035 [Opitutae bacterium]|nr:hypothetical protein [Opitutae bacterium]
MIRSPNGSFPSAISDGPVTGAKVAVSRWGLGLRTATAVALVAGGGLWATPNLSLLVTEWDEGNVIYAPMAWNHGQVPNIDFVHGYPGLMAFVQAGLQGCGMDTLRLGKLLALICGLLTATGLAWMGNRLFGFAAGALVFVCSFWSCYDVWPLLNPGYAANACTVWGVVALYESLRSRRVIGRRSINVGTWVCGAFLVGLAVSFKQSGVFGLVGIVLGAVAICPVGRWATWPRWAAYAMVVLPLSVFLLARVAPNLATSPCHSIAALPWIAAAVTTLQRGGDGEAARLLEARDLVWAVVAMVLGATAWLFMYPDLEGTARELIYEIWVRVPQLIDRHVEDLGFKPNLVACLAVAGVYLVCVRTHKHRGKRVAVGVLALLGAVVLPLRGAASAERVLASFSPIGWDTYVVPALAGTVGVLWLPPRPIRRVPPEQAFLLLSGVVGLAALFPYPGNYRYAGLALFTCYATAVVAIGQRGTAASIRRSTLLVFLLIATLAAITDIAHRRSGRDAWSRKDYPTLGISVQASDSCHVFVEISGWLAMRLAYNETIGGYPNYGLVFGLLQRPSASRLPNFIGDQGDFSRLVDHIRSGQGPDVFLVSPDNYPYPVGFAYFPDPEPLIEALGRDYALWRTVTVGSREVRVYRRWNKDVRHGLPSRIHRVPDLPRQATVPSSSNFLELQFAK